MFSMEVVIFASGIAALVFAAVTLSSLQKLKNASGLDMKHYKMAKDLQIAQLVVSSLVVLLSGWAVIGAAAKKHGHDIGYDTLSRYAKQLVG